MDEIFNIEVLAEDNVRILNLPTESYKKPLVIILVGYPGSGKSYLTSRLKEVLPITILKEENMREFLSPRATIINRSDEKVFQLATATIIKLIKKGKAIVYDANVKSKQERIWLKSEIERAGGRFLLISVTAPKKICYERIQRKNYSVSRGEIKGFIMNKEYFEYEIASTQMPTKEEPHLNYDSTNRESLSKILTLASEMLKIN